MMRKKRSDRNYIIYRLSINGLSYIGLTVLIGRAVYKSVKIRTQKHISRALIEDKNWTLCNAIRNTELVEYEVLDVIRGRKDAYQLERQYIRELSPALNDF